MEVVCKAGDNLVLVRCKVVEIKEQDVNARVVAPEMQERLQATIANEKRLESLPFGVLRGDNKFVELISGHHRLRAAQMAGLKEILILADTRDLSREQVVAKQLAHNAIGGHDDAQVLSRLLSEINTPDLKLEAFVKLDDLKIPDVKIEGLDDTVRFKVPVVALVFMPEQKEAVEKIFTRLAAKIPKDSDEVWLAESMLMELMSRVMTKVSRTDNVRSVSAILVRMCEIVEQHLDAEDGVKITDVVDPSQPAP